jgi:hypothetical protein
MDGTRLALGVLVFVANAAGGAALAAPPPAGTVTPAPVVHERRPGLMVGGAVVFGLSWAPAVVLSGAMLADGCCPKTAASLWIPVLGPMTALPAHDRGIGILWSAAQLAGVAMFAYGMVGHDVPPAPTASRPPAVHFVPMLARDAGGMTLSGRW